MKKVLILAYDFPPYFSIGAARPYSWYKYFCDNNLYPVVVTRHWDAGIKSPVDTIRSSTQTEISIEINPEGTIIRCPYKANFRDKFLIKYGDNKFKYFRKIVSFLFYYIRFFFIKIDSSSNIYFEAKKYLSSNKVSCIIATTEPFILFKYASVLSRKSNVPWIADYRDGFSTNNLLKIHQKFYNKIVANINRKLEQSVLRNVLALTSAAPSYIDEICKELPHAVKSKVIFNGFDEWIKYPRISENNYTNSILKIAYSGRLYKHHPVESFFEIISQVHKKHPEINFEISFYGLEFFPDDVKRISVAANGIISHVNILPRLNYEDYMNELSDSDLLILFAQDGVDWLNAKLFDYFSVSKKIVLFRNDNSILNELIRSCNAGISINNNSELFSLLEYSFVQLSHGIRPTQLVENIETYSRKHQAYEMAKYIESCVE